MKEFMNELKDTLKNDFNESITENGMVGYNTTTNPIVDMTFRVSSYRNDEEDVIIKDFVNAYYFNRIITLKWLFYARDVRKGLGERRLFRICMNWLANEQPNDAMKLITLISEYGRWDDVIELCKCNNNDVKNYVFEIIKKQLFKDLKDMNDNKSISLLAKWMPSCNTSSKEKVLLGKKFAKYLYPNMYTPEKYYRRLLSSLRKYIDVIEVKMSKNEWNQIKYENVPSKANLLYKNAFYRHDADRYEQFINNVKEGKQKINSETNYPHDIVHKYYTHDAFWLKKLEEYDETLEQLWKALPNYVNDNSSTLVVADGSGSMMRAWQNTNVNALEIANSLAIYFAERCKGVFKDKYITFSSNPQLVELNNNGNNGLRDKLMIANSYSEIANTNIKRTFDLILKTAINGNLSQDDMPQNILILSDMEFDACGDCCEEKDFNKIFKEYNDAGYKVPKLIFWNINSRTKTIPILQNDLGVILVSGFSPSIMNMVLSNETNPYNAILSVLNDKRYNAIEDALQ